MFNVYAFGSFLRSSTPRDVDLLITYDELGISIPEALQLRARVTEQVTALTGLPADVRLLSIHEDRETRFSQIAAAKLIYQGSDVTNSAAWSSALRSALAMD